MQLRHTAGGIAVWRGAGVSENHFVCFLLDSMLVPLFRVCCSGGSASDSSFPRAGFVLLWFLPSCGFAVLCLSALRSHTTQETDLLSVGILSQGVTWCRCLLSGTGARPCVYFCSLRFRESRTRVQQSTRLTRQRQ